jgi:hypothetical protein
MRKYMVWPRYYDSVLASSRLDMPIVMRIARLCS